MTRYVGVDYGTSMLKAAVTSGIESKPALLRLEPPDPFLACAVRLPSGEQSGVVGREAYLRRRRADSAVAFGFRDRVLRPDSSLVVGGTAHSGIEIQAVLLDGLRKRVAVGTGGDTDGLAMAIPDHWSGPQWSLPLVLDAAECTPTLCAREWAATLLMNPGLESDKVLLMSLGYGTCRATVCGCSNGVWQPLVQTSDAELSGEALRKRLADELCENIISETRRDPREDDASDQAVHDAIEMALRHLITERETSLVAKVGYQQFARRLTRDDIATQARTFRVRLETVVERLLADPRVDLERCELFVWGELALLLPLGEWLERFCPRRTPLTTLPLDVVAAGAARLCSAIAQHPSAWPDSSFGAVLPASGDYSQQLSPSPQEGVVRVLERLPERLVAARATPTAALVLLTETGDGERREMTGSRFGLGREPDSDWVFQSSEYPTVSGNHAIILHDGPDFVIKDLGSSNGTYLNGAEVRDEHVLKSGDVISLGQQGVQLRFECGS